MRRYAAIDEIIEVEVRAFPAVWWLLVGFEVRVGGRIFHPRLDQASFFAHPVTEFHVISDGRYITGFVRGIGSRVSLRRKRYSLVVGMAELARDTQPVRGWMASCVVALTLWVILNLAVAGAIAVAWLVYRGRH